MPKRHDKITKSVNYDYYWDILFCTVPLLAVSCFYYGARPLLMMAADLLPGYPYIRKGTEPYGKRKNRAHQCAGS